MVGRPLNVNHHELAELALQEPARPDRAVLLAYLNGERNPNRPYSRGVLGGIRSDSRGENWRVPPLKAYFVACIRDIKPCSGGVSLWSASAGGRCVPPRIASLPPILSASSLCHHDLISLPAAPQSWRQWQFIMCRCNQATNGLLPCISGEPCGERPDMLLDGYEKIMKGE